MFLSWPARAGVEYTLEASEDGVTWFDAAPPAYGAGQTISIRAYDIPDPAVPGSGGEPEGEAPVVFQYLVAPFSNGSSLVWLPSGGRVIIPSSSLPPDLPPVTAASPGGDPLVEIVVVVCPYLWRPELASDPALQPGALDTGQLADLGRLTDAHAELALAAGEATQETTGIASGIEGAVSLFRVSANAQIDGDGDGIPDFDELELGTHPLDPDSDGDGYFDGDELALGSDPKAGGESPDADDPGFEDLYQLAEVNLTGVPSGLTATADFNGIAWTAFTQAGPSPQPEIRVFRRDAGYRLNLAKTGAQAGAANFTLTPIDPGTWKWWLQFGPEVDDGEPPEVSGPEISPRATLIPIDVPPDVLRVNSDFDEGSVDPGSGYAVADSDELDPHDPTLIARRNAPDGTYSAGDHVTGDLHEGFYGIRPGYLPPEEFEGTAVTITRLDLPDPETGLQGTGRVRFHSLVETAGGTAYRYLPVYNPATAAAEDLVPWLYAESPTIPVDARLWIEGVEPGWISLEYRITGDGEELARHVKSFRVCTHQLKDDWQTETHSQILLQTTAAGTAVDLAGFDPAAPFTANIPYIQSIYAYYDQLFVEHPEELMWAGMAKLAGSTVYAGLSDTQYAREHPIAALPFSLGSDANKAALQTALMDGNRRIFRDLGWQHRAFVASGTCALEWVSENDPDPELIVLPLDLDAWADIAEGIRQGGNADLIRVGCRALLEREQRNVIPPVYSAISAIPIVLGFSIDDAMSWLATNPIPRRQALGAPLVKGVGFWEFTNGGNLGVFDDRWAWIHAPGGTETMYELWTGTSSKGLIASERMAEVVKPLSVRAREYAQFPDDVP